VQITALRGRRTLVSRISRPFYFDLSKFCRISDFAKKTDGYMVHIMMAQTCNNMTVKGNNGASYVVVGVIVPCKLVHVHVNKSTAPTLIPFRSGKIKEHDTVADKI
jgi:hypothetical protein